MVRMRPIDLWKTRINLWKTVGHVGHMAYPWPKKIDLWKTQIALTRYFSLKWFNRGCEVADTGRPYGLHGLLSEAL